MTKDLHLAFFSSIAAICNGLHIKLRSSQGSRLNVAREFTGERIFQLQRGTTKAHLIKKYDK